MITLPIYNQKGKQLKKMELDPQVFDGRVNQDVLHQAVLMYNACSRKGVASTKTRGEVSGGGRKPWRQKGTGRARVGSSRNPLWRKGGVVFGPHPRDFGFSLPKRIKLDALKSSLNAKLKENNLVILDALKLDSPKTKQAIKILSDLKLDNKSMLLVLEQIDGSLKRGFQNIRYLDIIKASDSCALDILRVGKLIVSVEGLKVLVERIKKRIG